VKRREDKRRDAHIREEMQYKRREYIENQSEEKRREETKRADYINQERTYKKSR